MFKKNVVQQKNVLHSLEPHPYPDEEAKAILKASIEYLEKRIKEMEKALYDLTAEDYEKQLRLLLTIKGIGRVTAIALIELTNGFKHFDNPKELANFIGIAPAYRQSGTSVRYGGQMTRSGDSTIRGLLYMCSLSAIRWNMPCQALYNRLKERKKASKIALVAVAHKLVLSIPKVVRLKVFTKSFDRIMNLISIPKVVRLKDSKRTKLKNSLYFCEPVFNSKSGAIKSKFTSN